MPATHVAKSVPWSQTNDITYYYGSRLPGEPPAGVNDVHFHRGEKRSFRVTLAYSF